MKIEIADEWIKRLRSGEYLQGRSVLKQDENDKCLHCCLGVLCEMYVEAHPEANWQLAVGNSHARYYKLCGIEMPEAAVLPREVIEWSGMDSTTGLFESSSLAQINDKGYTFEMIADIIEANKHEL